MVKKAILRVREVFYSLLTIISPELNTKARYFEIYRKKLNMSKPSGLVEKLLVLKITDYNVNPLVQKCADKYRVREYVREVGLGDILIDLYGAYDSFDDIPLDRLPDSFVLKMNTGATMNIICKEKESMDIEACRKRFNKWFKRKYWLPYAEMQYKCEKKLVLCEKYLEPEGESCIPDYKVYCFNGEPKAIFVMHDRGEHIKTEFFNTNWVSLKNTNKYDAPEKTTEKPRCLEQMLEAAKILSNPFPFVRCDFYIVNNKLYFGELTFTPAGGLFISQCQIDGRDMGDYLTLQ